MKKWLITILLLLTTNLVVGAFAASDRYKPKYPKYPVGIKDGRGIKIKESQ
jgi:hypothetical protein